MKKFSKKQLAALAFVDPQRAQFMKNLQEEQEINPKDLIGPPGPEGVSVVDAFVDDGNLIITLSSGEEIIAGRVSGENGEKGERGEDGKDGASIQSAEIQNANLILSFSDGKQLNLGRVVGKDGEPGAPGKNGEPGVDGKDAVVTDDIIKKIKALVVQEIPEAKSKFTELEDTPDTLPDNKILATEKGKIVLKDFPKNQIKYPQYPPEQGGGGATRFTKLKDVPQSYAGQAGKKVVVKNDESGLEFVPDSSSSVTSNNAHVPISSNVLSYVDALPITHANMVTAKTNETLVDGFYNIINPQHAYQIIVRAQFGNTVDTSASALFLNADYQDVGDYSNVGVLTGTPAGTRQGVWEAANEGTYATGDIVIWNGKHWQVSDDANLNGTNPATNNTAFTEIIASMSGAGYVAEWSFVMYDFDNDLIVFRQDQRNNQVFGANNNSLTSPTFQFGNDNVYGNTWSNGYTANIINQTGTYANNNPQSIETWGGVYLISDLRLTDADMQALPAIPSTALGIVGTANLFTDITFIESATSLRRIDFGDNLIDTIPADFTIFPNLVFLVLYDNELTDFSSNFNGLQLLEKVIIYSNKIVTFNPDFTGCDNLFELNVSNNLLSSMSVPLDNLPSLTQVFFNDNDLDATSVDQIIIDVSVSAAITPTINGEINLADGTNAAPTAASSSAISSLLSQGWTITTN